MSSTPASTPELATCIRDLLALLALPALSSGRDALGILQLTLTSLESVLPLELAYAVHDPPAPEARIEALRMGRVDASSRIAEHRQQLDALVSSKPGGVPAALGVQKTFLAPLGYYAQQGALLLGSADPTFPRPTDLILIQAAASLTTTALENARLMRESLASSRAKDEFLAMLGHELRNPLSPILTAVQLLKLRSSGGREIDIIERQARRLVLLVDDMMDLSRITRGAVVLDRECLDLSEVVAGAIEVVSPMITERTHTLQVDVPSGLRVYADPMRANQMVSNLLTNAAKYTEPGGRIELRAESSGSNAVLTVEDDGTGIAPDLLPHIFDLFVRGPLNERRHPGGLGIGLALVKNLAQLHGGSVEAASKGIGEGSTFRLVLPMPAEGMADAHSDAGSAPQPAGLVDQRVLIVDDDEDAASLLADLLQASGYDVSVAHDGVTAVDAIQRFRPSIAIVDIGLPGIDGHEVAARTRCALGADTPRLIALSGYGQAGDRERSAALGFEAHLVKPVSSSDLFAVLGTRGIGRMGG